MKEIEKVLVAVAEGLKAMALGINTIAEKVVEIAKAPDSAVKPKPAPAKAATRKKSGAKEVRPTGSGKAAAKPVQKNKTKGQTKTTAIDTVFQMFENAEDGIDTATIIQVTGFNAKKVANLLYKLKQQEKIVRVDRGRYKGA